MLTPPQMSRVHGTFNMLGGLWPAVHLRSFEAVFGPKVDKWLEYTVAGLLMTVGYAQVRASGPDDWQHGRRLGLATATTLLAIDLIYVPKGRIRWTYLIDAAEEIALIGAWAAVSRERRAVT